MTQNEIINKLQTQLDDIRKYGDVDDVITLVPDETETIINLLKEHEETSVAEELEFTGYGLKIMLAKHNRKPNELANYLGISKSSISHWFEKNTIPKKWHNKIAEFLETEAPLEKIMRMVDEADQKSIYEIRTFFANKYNFKYVVASINISSIEYG